MRILLVLLLIGLATPAFAAEPAAPVPVKLSAKDRVTTAAIISYLNDLKSVAADFLQVDDHGEMRHGKIAIQRPGKMRVTYDPPQKDFIVADGSLVHIWDDELKQQTNVPVGDGIAELILRDPIQLDGDVTLTKFERFPAKIEVTVVATDNPGDGALTLIFEDKPLLLRQWRVVDAQGRTTGVNLENAREGVSFPSNMFDFVAPNLGKNYRNTTLRK